MPVTPVTPAGPATPVTPVGPVAPVAPTTPAVTIAIARSWLLEKLVVPVPPDDTSVTGTSQ